MWIDELKPAQNGSVPTTLLITLDENMNEVPFAACQGWTYELKIKEKTPQCVYDQKYGNPPKPPTPGELVLIGLQLEDGPRIERKVKSELSEHGLKLLMWETLGYPRGPLYLHIKNARDETEFAFKISPKWTYILRRRPVDMLKKKKGQLSVDGEDGDMRSATWKMREARIIGKSGGAGASGTAAQGTGDQRGKNSTEARTTTSGTSRAPRKMASSLSKSAR
jgi:hypothetical protein